MDDHVAATIPEDGCDFTALVPGEALDVLARIGRKPAPGLASGLGFDHHAIAAVERAVDVDDAGGEEALALAQRARRAVVDDDRAGGVIAPAIQVLRAERGSARGTKSVALPPASIAASGPTRPGGCPLAISIAQPALVAIRAAASFVTMPPELCPTGAGPAIASIAGPISSTRGYGWRRCRGGGRRCRGLYTADREGGPPGYSPGRRDRPGDRGDGRAGAGRAQLGGMVTKLPAARIATNAGCAMLIAGRPPGRVGPLAAIEAGGKATLFVPPRRAALGAQELDRRRDGPRRRDHRQRRAAASALRKGKSLLPAGIVNIDGGSDRSDTW